MAHLLTNVVRVDTDATTFMRTVNLSNLNRLEPLYVIFTEQVNRRDMQTITDYFNSNFQKVIIFDEMEQEAYFRRRNQREGFALAGLFIAAIVIFFSFYFAK